MAPRKTISNADCNAIDLQAERPKNYGVSRLMIGSANAVWIRHLEPYGSARLDGTGRNRPLTIPKPATYLEEAALFQGK